MKGDSRYALSKLRLPKGGVEPHRHCGPVLTEPSTALKITSLSSPIAGLTISDEHLHSMVVFLERSMMNCVKDEKYHSGWLICKWLHF